MKKFLSSLFFMYSLISFAQKEITIEGVVKDEAGKIVNADITLEDENGDIIITTKNEPKTGAYNIKLKYNSSKKYFLCFSNSSTFFNAFPLDFSAEAPKELDYKNVVLKRIKANSNYVVGNIGFTPSDDAFRAYSYTSLKNLKKILMKYPNMSIEIEGHTGANVYLETNQSWEDEDFHAGHDASAKMANTVYDYLVKEGIDKSRMGTLGYSDKRTIYPVKHPYAIMLNNRIEIKIISL